MKESILAARALAASRPGGALLDRMSRGAIVRRFTRLAGGRLTFEDELGTWTAPSKSPALTRAPVTAAPAVPPPTADSPLAATVRVRDPRFYRHVAFGGTLGAAESYLRGHWDCDDLVSFFRIILRDVALADDSDRGLARAAGLVARVAHTLRRNSRLGSRRNIRAHYDLGNEFFALQLDESMTYSCALFADASTSLEDAQFAKLDRVCRKLALRPSDHVLEIGGGWGSFARHAVRHFGCRVTTTTISREQREVQLERLQREGLADRVEVLFEDYRDLDGRYDKIASIEMVEAVGEENVAGYLRKISSLLESDGAALVQGITLSDAKFDHYRRSVDFIQRYVFPGSCLVSMSRFARAAAGAGDLRLEHVEEIGPHYVGTIRAWRERFHRRLDDVRRLGVPERFVRLWNYYFDYCEAGFLERFVGDAQFLLAKPGWRAPSIPALPAAPW